MAQFKLAEKEIDYFSLGAPIKKTKGNRGIDTGSARHSVYSPSKTGRIRIIISVSMSAINRLGWMDGDKVNVRYFNGKQHNTSGECVYALRLSEDNSGWSLTVRDQAKSGSISMSVRGDDMFYSVHGATECKADIVMKSRTLIIKPNPQQEK